MPDPFAQLLFPFAYANQVGVFQTFLRTHGGVDAAPDDGSMDRTAQMAGDLNRVVKIVAHQREADQVAALDDFRDAKLLALVRFRIGKTKSGSTRAYPFDLMGQHNRLAFNSPRLQHGR